MCIVDDNWLTSRGRGVVPSVHPSGMVERLKLVAQMLATAPVEEDTGLQRRPHLLWRTEKGEVVSKALPDDFLIGREGACDLSLSDSRVSRRHCRISFVRETAWLTDLESTNGTELNGQRIEVSSPLRDGDVITLGGQALVFVAGDSS